MAFSVLGILVVISLATPWFLVPLLPLGIYFYSHFIIIICICYLIIYLRVFIAYFYRYIQRYYVRSSRELKRLDSISKSPIFAHFSGIFFF